MWQPVCVMVFRCHMSSDGQAEGLSTAADTGTFSSVITVHFLQYFQVWYMFLSVCKCLCVCSTVHSLVGTPS